MNRQTSSFWLKGIIDRRPPFGSEYVSTDGLLFGYEYVSKGVLWFGSEYVSIDVLLLAQSTYRQPSSFWLRVRTDRRPLVWFRVRIERRPPFDSEYVPTDVLWFGLEYVLIDVLWFGSEDVLSFGSEDVAKDVIGFKQSTT